MAKRQRLVANSKHRDGFTFVELLAVLIIIAVLVAIAVPVYNSAQQTARDRVDEANVRILNSATLQWLLADEANDPTAKTTDQLREELEGVYVTDWPVSPNAGKTYVLDDGFWKVQ